MLTITRKDLLLTINDNVIPAMGSSDVPVKFVNDTETYVDFLIEPRVGYYVNGCPKSTVCEYDTSSNIIKIPAEAFKNKGILVIAIALIDNEYSNHIEVTKELALEVTPAPNGTVILPATDTWQTAVKNLVEQLYNQDYKPQFDQIEEDLSGLVEEAQNQQDKANNQQTQIDNAIDVMGDYEIVQENPTQIRFKKGNGTYGDTVNLGDNLASKSMVNAGYDTYSGNSYSGSASDYGIEIGKASGNYKQEGTPTPESPIEPKFFEPKNGYSVGKNMFDKDNVVANNRVSGKDGTFSSQTGTYRTDYIDINSDFVSIFISGNKTSQTATSEVLAWYDNEKNFISGERMEGFGVFPNKSYEIPSNASYVIFNFGNEDKDEIQLSYGSTEQPYTPFVGQSAIPLNITLRALPNEVCDTYEDGVITRRIGVIEFDGSDDEFCNKNDASDNDNWLYSITYHHIKAVALSNKLEHKNLTGINGDSSLDRVGFNLDYHASVIYINIGYYMQQEGLSNNKGDLKTYLQSNPIKVWYELAEPYTEQVDLPVIPSYSPYTNAWHDSEVEASDLTWHVLTAVNGKSSIRDGLGALLKDAPMTPNDNLLINSDYRSGIINQKGQTSYVNNSLKILYTIDKWSISGNGKVIVNDGYIRVESTSDEPFYFTQKLEKQINEVCTSHSTIKNYSGDIGFAIIGNDGNNKTVKISKTGSILNNHTEAEGVSFALTGVSSFVEIYDVKLEKGKQYTGMYQINEALELLKCQYDSVLVKAYNAFSARADGTYLSFLIPCQKMRKTPSIKNNKLFIVGNGESTSYTGEITCVNTENGIRCVIDYQKTGSYTVCFEQDTILDSREY